MTVHKSIFLLLTLLLPACATAPWPLLQKIHPLNPDGTLAEPLADKEISPFLEYLRSRIPPQPPQPTAIFALEVDVPQGRGVEGDYLALIYTGAKAELQYYRQIDHRPRVDRYFHRNLTAAEIAEFDEFLKTHPLAQIQNRVPENLTPATGPVVPATVPDTPATAPAPVFAPEALAQQMPISYRFTDARLTGAQTLVLQSPGKEEPASALLGFLAKLRDAAPFACSYTQPIPLTATSLYADPYRRVLWVWNNDDDLRIAVTSPLRPMDTPPAGPDENWLAYKDQQWQPCAPPGTDPPAATQPTTQPAATQPATTMSATTEPATTQPVRRGSAWPLAPEDWPSLEELLPGIGSVTDRLPQRESWWTQTNLHATTVFRYVPLSTMHGVTHGFVVPTFVFDDDHFAVNQTKGLLYLIHEGQLFSLVIPKTVLE